MKQFVGIDNSNTGHEVHIRTEEGVCLRKFSIKNEVAGFIELENKLGQANDETLIGFEVTHGPIVDFLKAKGYSLCSLNPLKIKRFKETMKVSGDKNDSIDAAAIAEYLRLNEKNLRRMTFSSKKVERIKILGISYNRLSREHARLVNRLLFIVRQYFPLHDGLFSGNSKKIQLKMILAFPTWNA